MGLPNTATVVIHTVSDVPDKPDWLYAPFWANWLACDLCGNWQWFQYRPFLNFSSTVWVNSRGNTVLERPFNKYETALHIASEVVAQSLEERPDD